jgi:hypothetical protein
MITVDDLLLKIVNFSTPTIEEQIPARDARVLRSLGSSITATFFITENQSRLLIKILKENRKKLEEFSEEIDLTLKDPIWSKSFRQIEQLRKVSVDYKHSEEGRLNIDFTFNSQIRKILTESKKIEGLTQIHPGKTYTADYTEKYIVALFELLDSHEFTFDEPLYRHYDTIKSWSENEVKKPFFLGNFTHTAFQRLTLEDSDLQNETDEVIITDRSKRFQYLVEKTEKNPENLTDIIAYREKSRIWVSSTLNTLDEIFESLVNLRRFPLLVIFPNYDEKRAFQNLENLSNSLEKSGISEDVGIYFRMDNNEEGKRFNQLISSKQYNHKLTKDTKIVAIQSGKIPKFLIKSAWQPMSVLSLDNNLRHNKAGVYSECCDLVITYSDTEPLMSGILR